MLVTPTLTRTALPVGFDAAHDEVEVDGEKIRELVTLEPETRVTFERLSGKVMGTIFNVIEGDDVDLERIRHSWFSLAGGHCKRSAGN